MVLNLENPSICSKGCPQISHCSDVVIWQSKMESWGPSKLREEKSVKISVSQINLPDTLWLLSREHFQQYVWDNSYLSISLA